MDSETCCVHFPAAHKPETEADMQLTAVTVNTLLKCIEEWARLSKQPEREICIKAQNYYDR